MTNRLLIIALLSLAGIPSFAHAQNRSAPRLPAGPVTAENVAEALATPVEKRTEEQKALVYANIQAENRARREKERLDNVRELEVVRAEKLDLAKLLDSQLTDVEGKPVSIEAVKKARYVVFYHSSSWCCGCKTYTPLLIEAAKKFPPGEVAILLVSWDKPGPETRKYLASSGIPWPSITKATLADSPARLAIRSIPHLRVYDASGSMVLDSLDKEGNHTGQTTQIEALKRLLSTPSPVQ